MKLKVLMGLKMGLFEILTHKLRSFLTMLGVILGVASLITLFALIEGGKQETLTWMKAAGGLEKVVIQDQSTDKKDLKRSRYNRSSGRTLGDAQAIAAKCSLVAAVSPEIDQWYQIKYRGKERGSRVQGVTPGVLQSNNYEVARGRFFSAEDQRECREVCVLGTKIVDELFGKEEPLGKTVLFNDHPVEVIGVLKKYELMSGKENAMDWKNDICFVPINSLIKRVQGTEKLTWLNLKITETDHMTEALDQVKSLLLKRHGVEDFKFQTHEEWMTRVNQTILMWDIVLGSIGGICLLTGGIGIMNIMLASVNERTREIGIRRALGARRRDILFQFMIETLMLAVSGGALGILAGIGMAEGAAWGYPDLRPAIQTSPIVLAFSFSLVVGLFFGIYPALQASKLDPVEALRYE